MNNPKPKAPPLSRITPTQVGPQDVGVEKLEEFPSAGVLASQSAGTTTQNRPASRPRRFEPATKRTFRWSAQEDRELLKLIDQFNNSLPAGAKRLRMEHLGRVMRKHFISSDTTTLLRDAYREAYPNAN